MLAVLEVMGVTEVEGDHVTSETVANAAVRSVDFVTSAVSMATLPSSTSGTCTVIVGVGIWHVLTFISFDQVSISTSANSVLRAPNFYSTHQKCNQ